MKISKTITSIAVAMLTVASALAETKVQDSKPLATYAPRPQYPYEARSKGITGRGVAVMTIDPKTGLVTRAKMASSTGSPILDNAALSAFGQWRFKPGTVTKVRIPFYFTAKGASY